MTEREKLKQRYITGNADERQKALYALGEQDEKRFFGNESRSTRTPTGDRLSGAQASPIQGMDDDSTPFVAVRSTPESEESRNVPSLDDFFSPDPKTKPFLGDFALGIRRIMGKENEIPGMEKHNGNKEPQLTDVIAVAAHERRLPNGKVVHVKGHTRNR